MALLRRTCGARYWGAQHPRLLTMRCPPLCAQIGIKGGEYFADALKYNNTISTLDLRANALGDEVSARNALTALHCTALHCKRITLHRVASVMDPSEGHGTGTLSLRV